jgi:hypothetical protein
MSRVVTPLADRFWAKVHRSTENDCWPWQAALAKTGYGVIGLGRKHDGVEYSHRVAWSLTNGAIPDELFVLHRCDNRRCCNPSHLFLGTHADNMRDAASKGRLATQARPDCAARGDAHPNAHLSADDVRAIRALGQLGARRGVIATEFGVSPSLVWLINTNRLWKHVASPNPERRERPVEERS